MVLSVGHAGLHWIGTVLCPNGESGGMSHCNAAALRMHQPSLTVELARLPTPHACLADATVAGLFFITWSQCGREPSFSVWIYSSC